MMNQRVWLWGVAILAVAACQPKANQATTTPAQTSAPLAENTVAVHIRHLREKVEINPAEPRYLKVIWGRGYKIDAE